MNPVFTIISLLSLLGGNTLNIMKSGMRKYQKKCLDIATPIIKANLHKPFVSQRMFITQSLLQYSKDKDLFEMFFAMTKTEQTNFLKNKFNNILNNFSFNDISEKKGFVFVIWAGGKSNYKKLQQFLLDTILKKNPQITKYYDVFLGGFGAIYNALPILIKHGVKEVFASDINVSLVYTYKQVQNNYKNVQRHLASIPLEYFKEHEKYYPETNEESKALFFKIHREFTILEKSKRNNAKRAAYFLYLNAMSRAGMLNYDMKIKLNKFDYSFDENKLKKIPFLINKVEIFHKIFNLEDITIKFSIKKYQTVLKEIKNDETAFILYDSPYIKYEEVLSDKVRNCSYNYGINDFNQKELLFTLKNSKNPFIYFNNHNPLIENFAVKYSFNYHKEEVVYKNGNQKTKNVEILMYSDRDLSVKPLMTFNSLKDKENNIEVEKK